ncbi:cytochrome c3 family protein [Sulfurirhabdus autotrophica]|uniref:Class III cytochrome C family protein n=1 Tax=Sulfurirhabdus autotrophica TaxID=1706046 RepID=A0A4R3YG49_9PROT|nr:cytochrome c3 family protein [Sulfurirhabdus autotrophica]TCV89513.1 class III cytochrome C family protein [Sulfurirhabdus autotrophica]
MLLRFIFTSLLLLLTSFAGVANAAQFEKALMPGAVIQGHAKYELDCNKCHKRFDKVAQAKLCVDCHKEIAADISSKTRMHGKLEDSTCRNCHTEHKGRNAKLAVLDKEKFDHSYTNFQLKGAHKDARTKCASCHVSKVKYRDTPKLCNDCHKQDDQEKGHKGSLGKKCESCHDEKSWKEARFDHEKTKFSLLGGKHADVKCKECHADKTFQHTPLTCNGCHKKDDQEKGHKGRYGTKCESCHNDKGWKEITFNHDADTHYALKGKHRQAKCESCHLPEKGALYQQQKLPTKCVACHKKDDQDKGHRGNLGEKCETCHNERGWKNSVFDHDDTDFPLRDKHRDAKCESCHKGGISGPNAKIKVDKECVACHRKDDDAKGHKGRYGAKCETCHTAKDWKTSIFNHDRETKYALKGKHIKTKCDACHVPEKGPIYKVKLGSQCIDCHRGDDKHKGQLGNKCESCHNEKRWQEAPFDHNKSRFQLTGSHAKVECKKCHLTPAFKDAPSTCIACHEKDDKHKRRFGTKCESCHYTGTWQSWDFDHGTTRFALDGAHIKVACYDCHKETAGSQSKPGRACVSCHLKDDVHNGGFSGQCERCHVASSWKKVRR